MWLLTLGAPAAYRLEQAGTSGLARSARAELCVPLACLSGEARVALMRSASLREREAVLRCQMCCAPRLRTAPLVADGLVRLHFHSRSVIGNLFLEPQQPPLLLGEGEVRLRVRAVGLNFRDVLNLLDQYPGDPGPPGGDMAGEMVEADVPFLLPAGGR